MKTLLEIQSFGMQRKAHGAQTPKTYLVDRQGGEHRATPRCARKMNLQECL